MTAPRFRLLEVERFEWPFRLRMPFRFGVITVTHGRQAVVRARIAIDGGGEHWGIAAETLAAKWFDKDPRWTDAQNEHQLRRALEIACDATLAAGANTAFGHYADAYAAHVAACGAEGAEPADRRLWPRAAGPRHAGCAAQGERGCPSPRGCARISAAWRRMRWCPTSPATISARCSRR